MKDTFPKPKNNWTRLVSTFLTYLLITVLLAYGVSILFPSIGDAINLSPNKEVPLSQVVDAIKAREVERIVVEDNILTVYYKDSTQATSQKEIGVSIYEILNQSGITDLASYDTKIEVKTSALNGFWGQALSGLLPIVIMIVFFLIIFRQAGKNAGGVMDFGKSTAKGPSKNQSKVSFKDAAGVDEAIKELEEVVDFLRNPEKYRKLGARIPKGVLLIGPAGTGKTLLAKAVANEAQVPFFSMAGSEFMEMLVGVGASRVRDLFKQAKESAPSLIFIDEIESIGRQRGRSIMTSHGEQEQTLNQILVEMDGFSPNDNVIVLAATNRPDLLDTALIRPGRFDRQVALQLPDIEGRAQIITIHIKNKPLTEDVDIHKIAQMTVGFSGAELENMLNEAAILAAATGKDKISSFEIKESITKVRLGRERRHLQSDLDKKITAYHEAGHAVVANKLPEMDPVQRVSIVSRGLALGFTEISPESDRSHQTKTYLLHKISALLGGRAAEELIFNDRTVGAGSDLEQASTIAYRMVNSFGMSDLGPVAFVYKDKSDQFDNPFSASQYSEQMLSKIDQEIKGIIDTCYSQSQKILKENQTLLDEVVNVLLKEETIEQDRFNEIVAKHQPA